MAHPPAHRKKHTHKHRPTDPHHSRKHKYKLPTRLQLQELFSSLSPTSPTHPHLDLRSSCKLGNHRLAEYSESKKTTTQNPHLGLRSSCKLGNRSQSTWRAKGRKPKPTFGLEIFLQARKSVSESKERQPKSTFRLQIFLQEALQTEGRERELAGWLGWVGLVVTLVTMMVASPPWL